MMNFLLLWKGISLGSDAPWKLKQRSVTQLRAFYLLVSTNKYTVSGVTSFKLYLFLVIVLFLLFQFFFVNVTNFK